MEPRNAEYYYNRGMEFMEKKDYMEAQQNFQIVVDSYSGSEYVDSAQYMLAETYYMNEDYITAAFEYERVFEDYPSSLHVAEAMFKRAVCYFEESPKASLDQENTNLAIDDFNRFIDTYPRHELVPQAQEYIDELREKLAYKEFNNAEIYRKLKKYDAAIIYYRLVITDYPRTTWANEARFGIGLVYLKQSQYERAREQFQMLVNADLSENLKNRAEERLSYIENRTQ